MLDGTFDEVSHEHLHPPRPFPPGPQRVCGDDWVALELIAALRREDVCPLLPSAPRAGVGLASVLSAGRQAAALGACERGGGRTQALARAVREQLAEQLGDDGRVHGWRGRGQGRGRQAAACCPAPRQTRVASAATAHQPQPARHSETAAVRILRKLPR